MPTVFAIVVQFVEDLGDIFGDLDYAVFVSVSWLLKEKSLALSRLLGSGWR